LDPIPDGEDVWKGGVEKSLWEVGVVENVGGGGNMEPWMVGIEQRSVEGGVKGESRVENITSDKNMEVMWIDLLPRRGGTSAIDLE